MSTDTTASLADARFAAYTGEFPDAYKRGYQEAGRFGFDGDLDWTGHERLAYRQGLADRYQDDHNSEGLAPINVD